MARNRARLVLGAGALALAAALGVAAVVIGGTLDPKPATAIEIVVRYSKFEPSQITVPMGVPVTITIRNDDPIDHEWIVGDEQVHEIHRVGTELLHPDRPTEVLLPAGETRVTTITFNGAGSLQYICHLPAHEAYGMVGTVTIR